MPRKPTGQPRGRPKGSGQLGEQTRLTVRIPLDLFQRLEDYAEGRTYTRGAPQLAYCVREAIEQYLDDKRQTKNTPSQPVVISGQTVNIPPVEDTVPLVPENKIRQTIKVQGPAVAMGKTIPAIPPVEDAPQAAPRPEPSASDTTTVAGQLARPGGRRSTARQLIVDLLRGHPEGLTAIELKVRLGLDKHIGDTLQGMVRQGHLEKRGSGQAVRYVAREGR